ncbi:methionyl-tRNA formyltransferase [Caldicellulosiruptor kronotskyensis 2002]|uniref:Methionyl-tRNA formyltransferase n=1 Tax=Caldicellulosiruptor kronotskyensis (strain DSM 18902 / VKM B-2412 / 2002) TaxID=632348 RepID=E4SFI1_CALK2|nr:methionyl-tRNA formyltransferase [Caldicellulosiruptor kronotskyensis]ADQ46506.1 methionyl-tRNA formyltransferase [Caldicellulosiruptor kronotskyensis 2002]
MGTPDFAVDILQKLIQEPFVNLKLVVTQPDKPVGRKQILTAPAVKEFAQKVGIEVVQPEKLKNNEDFLDLLKKIEPDTIVVVAYGKILPKEVLEIPKHGCINVHASLLPEYRGAAPIQRVLMDGKEYTGITIMKMDEGLDTGDILLQKEVKIENNDDILTLSKKLAEVGSQLLIETLRNIESITPVKQDHSRATYAPPIKKEEGKIDWNMSAKEIYNRFRALKIWPGIFTTFKGKLLKIHDIEIAQDNKDNINSNVLNGTVVEIDDSSIIIKVRDGLIRLRLLQLEGGKKISARDFVNGYKIKKGDVLA